MNQTGWYPGQMFRLRQAMAYTGCVPPVLSRASGLGLRWINAYANGHFPLEDQGHAGVIAEVLGISARWLITGQSSQAAQLALAGFERMPSGMPLRDRVTIRHLIEMLPSAEELAERKQLAQPSTTS